MHFDKKVQYLGAQENTLKDGSKFYKVSMFDFSAPAPVVVNVMGDRADLVSQLTKLAFGAPVLVHFALVAKDNLYRLSMVGLEPASK